MNRRSRIWLIGLSAFLVARDQLREVSPPLPRARRPGPIAHPAKSLSVPSSSGRMASIMGLKNA